MENSNEAPQVWKDWCKTDLGCLKERWENPLLRRLEVCESCKWYLSHDDFIVDQEKMTKETRGRCICNRGHEVLANEADFEKRWVPDECIRLDRQIEANPSGKNRP